MNTLENYFNTEYKDDDQELSEIEGFIKETLQPYLHMYNTPKKGWPYRIETPKTTEAEKDGTNSISTQSMILSMFMHPHRNECNSNLYPYTTDSFTKKILDENGKPINKDTMEDFVNNALSNYIGLLLPQEFTSSTYGTNDPLSLLWAYEILSQEKKHCTQAHQALVDSIISKIKELSKGIKQKVFSREYDNILTLDDKDTHIHSFIVLRAYQLISATGVIETTDSCDDLFEFFEKRLHLHLSYFDIPDARFDPAELTFCLEGALLVKGRDSVSEEAIRRAFHVIERSQDSTPYWRPINPIYATRQGQILLPLSVEVANSIIRTCAKLDSAPTKESIFSKHSGIFKRYFRWLKAQHIKFRTKYCDREFDCCGWGSEHIGKNNEIHLWQTAEIIVFLMGYHSLLQRRIAARSLDASGLKVTSYTRPSSQLEHFRSLQKIFEPLSDFHEQLQLYKHLEQRFITPRVPAEATLQATPTRTSAPPHAGCAERHAPPATPASGADQPATASTAQPTHYEPHYSLLLYGPPGTGKSTVAENIASTLGWKLITVTPSDFLAGGAAEVEARAKAIFRCMETQSDAVILFDEIDHFLLDRESTEYAKQTGIFQFMTPGMLPKLNDLRKKERCIFIIATNYEERIDPAIKRTGRIDFSFPLMPPAFVTRKNIILSFLKDKNNPSISKEDFAARIAKQSTFCTYSDLKSKKDEIISHYEKNPQEVDTDKDILPEPSIRIGSYSTRIKRIGHDGRSKHHDASSVRKTPIDEYIKLTLIHAEKYEPSQEFDKFAPARLAEEPRDLLTALYNNQDTKKHIETLLDKNRAATLRTCLTPQNRQPSEEA